VIGEEEQENHRGSEKSLQERSSANEDIFDSDIQQITRSLVKLLFPFSFQF